MDAGRLACGLWLARRRTIRCCSCGPSRKDWPVGGDIDYAEVCDGTRQKLVPFPHYDKDNQLIHTSATIDMTMWNNFAVEWTNDHLIGYINGDEFLYTNNTGASLSRVMHATIQVDLLPRNGSLGLGKVEVDWIRQYEI